MIRIGSGGVFSYSYVIKNPQNPVLNIKALTYQEPQNPILNIKALTLGA